MSDPSFENEKNELFDTYNGDFISKSNILISGKYKSSLQANRINYINNLKLQNGHYTVDPETQELVVQLHPSEIVKMLNLKKGGSIYQSLDDVARQLIGTFIGVTDAENEHFRYINLVTESEYENGVLTTRYNPHMKKYLLNLKQNFTKLPRDLMMSWKSNTSYRMYELMRQRAYYPKTYTGARNGVFKITYDVYELRLLLGVVNSNLVEVRKILDGTNPPDYKRACEASPEKLYEDWYAFRRSVIDTAIKEINGKKNCDIEIEYKTLKKKHGEVYAVEFTIYLKEFYKKRDDDLPEVALSVDKDGKTRIKLSQEDAFVIHAKVLNLLEPYNIPDNRITLSDIVSICEAADYDLEKIKKAERILSKSSNVEGVVGWLIKAIVNDYKEPIAYKGSEKKKNPFLDFEQREYSESFWEELEEELTSSNR